MTGEVELKLKLPKATAVALQKIAFRLKLDEDQEAEVNALVDEAIRAYLPTLKKQIDTIADSGKLTSI